MITLFGALREMARWNTFLDILAIAAILYIFYMTLRATGTWKIAAGLFLAAIAAGIANLLDLQGVEWIFSNLSQITLIAMVIIFQPEIRRILERTISLGKGLSRDTPSALPELLDDVLFALADRRWGALVVVPGQVPIKQWITEGIALDGHLSFPLLLSLFDPDSPGHDGAVVVEDNKISCFGVRLPLSRAERLPSEYGTRHHAAMGLAEQTDSLVFAVSEERGVITVFQGGRFETLHRRGEVKEQCWRHGAGGMVKAISARAQRAPRTMTIELAACLLVALFFWGAVIAGRVQTRETTLTIPLEYSRPARNLSLAGDRQQTAKVVVKGPAAALSHLDPARLRLEVDLAALSEGRQTINLAEENIELPKEVKVLQIKPASVTVDLRALTTKKMEIIPQFVGEPPSGYRVAATEIIPKTVTVQIVEEGKKGEDLQLLTTPIYLQGIKKSMPVFCKIVVPSGVQPQDRRWPDVEVKITMEKE